MAEPAPVELMNLPVSPFSLRARWALAFNSIPYKTWTHTPILGEWFLKAKAKKLFSKERVTTPILITKTDGILYDSFDIASWANKNSRRTDGAKLFPADKCDEVKRWNDLSNHLSSLGRKAGVTAALNSEEARLSLAPPAILKMPGGKSVAKLISGHILSGLLAKFKQVDESATIETAREELKQFREALKNAGGQYLLGQFSYADIVMAIFLQALCEPGKPRKLPKDRATVAMPIQELYEENQDLIAWADGIFDKHYSQK